MVSLDNSTFFIQSTGNEIISTEYDYTRETYATNNNAMLSSHIVNDVKRISVTSSGDEFNTTRLYAINGDGSAAAFSRIASQEISNWCSMSTSNGLFLDVASLEDETWFIVKRTNDDDEVYFSLEKLQDDNVYLDACTTIDGLSGGEELTLPVYANHDVVVLGSDGYYETVSTGDTGSVTVPDGNTSVSIGFPISMELETMPVNIQSQSGHIRVKKKKVSESVFDIYESMGFEVYYGDKLQTIGNYTYDEITFTAPEQRTCLETLRWLGYKDEDCTLKVISESPYPVNIRAITTDVTYAG